MAHDPLEKHHGIPLATQHPIFEDLGPTVIPNPLGSSESASLSPLPETWKDVYFKGCPLHLSLPRHQAPLFPSFPPIFPHY